MQAQYGFCQVAADIAKDALTQQKGLLYVTAQQRMRELRNSLVPAYDQIANYNPYAIRLPSLPNLDDKCYDGKNRLKKRCAVAYSAVAAR